jgi:hypothetical protein
MGEQTCTVIIDQASFLFLREQPPTGGYTLGRSTGCARAHLPKPSGSVSITSATSFGIGANGGHAQFAAVDQKLPVPVVSLSLEHNNHSGTNKRR